MEILVIIVILIIVFTYKMGRESAQIRMRKKEEDRWQQKKYEYYNEWERVLK